jgi:hypothetical protein
MRFTNLQLLAPSLLYTLRSTPAYLLFLPHYLRIPIPQCPTQNPPSSNVPHAPEGMRNRHNQFLPRPRPHRSCLLCGLQAISAIHLHSLPFPTRIPLTIGNRSFVPHHAFATSLSSVGQTATIPAHTVQHCPLDSVIRSVFSVRKPASRTIEPSAMNWMCAVSASLGYGVRPATKPQQRPKRRREAPTR